MKKTNLFFSKWALGVLLFSSITTQAQWTTNPAGHAINNNPGNIGINTTTPDQLVTIVGGDLKIIETDDYSKSSDKNSADIYLESKNGGVLNIVQHVDYSGISIGGTSPELRVGDTFDRTNACTFFKNGSLAIGAIDFNNHLARPAGYRLFVKDGIMTEKLKIALVNSSQWADFVFNKDYKLMPLGQVEKFVKANHHLPGIPSANEVAENGIDVAQMESKLLQKVEELTLYMIELKKENEELKKRMKAVEASKK